MIISKAGVKELSKRLKWVFNQYAQDRESPPVEYIEKCIEDHTSFAHKDYPSVEEITNRWNEAFIRGDITNTKDVLSRACYETATKFIDAIDDLECQLKISKTNENNLRLNLDKNTIHQQVRHETEIWKLKDIIRKMEDSSRKLSAYKTECKPTEPEPKATEATKEFTEPPKKQSFLQRLIYRIFND